MRASDLDREQVAERLRKAAAEGRLLAEEFEQRLAHALRARTYGELDPLVADLPGGQARVARRRSMPPAPVLVLGAFAAVVAVAVLAVTLMVFAGLFAAWGVWLVVAWWIFGRGRRAGHRGRAQVRYVHRRGLL
jgi:hypothetical protein